MNKKLVITSDINNLAKTRVFVNEIVKEYNLQHIFTRIRYAINEAFINAVIHGNKNQVSKKIEIEFNHHGNCIEFIVSDEGNGFNHIRIPNPTAPENIKNETGRGLYIIDAYSDELTFADNGSTQKIKFNL